MRFDLWCFMKCDYSKKINKRNNTNRMKKKLHNSKKKHSMTANRNSVYSNIHTNSFSRHIQWCKHTIREPQLQIKHTHETTRYFKCNTNLQNRTRKREGQIGEIKYTANSVGLYIYISVYIALTCSLVRAVGNQNGAPHQSKSTREKKK